jgi:hypothetical protein
MEDKALDKVQYIDLAVDIHHIFPKKWCNANGIDAEHRESIVNKTAISALTNQAIGGAAPSAYLRYIEKRAQISPVDLHTLLASHLVPAEHLRTDDFDRYFSVRRELLCQLAEKAMGKVVPRDVDASEAEEDSSQFEESEVAETPEDED